MVKTTKKKNTKNHIKLAPKGETAVAEVEQAQEAPKKKKKKIWERNSFDYSLFTIVMIMLAFGIVMMFSASYVTAFRRYDDSLYYVKRQLIFAAVGVVALLFLATFDYHLFLNKYILRIIVIVSVALMLAVKVFGTTMGGAERWFEIGGITIQPSEILKFAVIILFAYFTNKNFGKLRQLWQGFMPFAVTMGGACLLLLIQPHLSGAIIVLAIGIAMMYVAGVSRKHLLVMIVLLIIGLIAGVFLLKAVGYDYFGDRILSFTNPEADIDDKTFQTYQSLVTIGSGGMFGLGFGNSRQKYSYLPASENDFLYSIICEELGFVGGVLVILLFVILIFRGYYIASHARDKTGMMIAFGITSQLGLQAFLNIAVATNSIPNTGISLPFFSYGGNALMMQLAEIGILLSISRKAELE